jgi:hypothetical protein
MNRTLRQYGLLILVLVLLVSWGIVGTFLGKQRFFGSETLVDVNSARIRRVQYRCFFPVKDLVETNAVAQLALVRKPKIAAKWVLAERNWICRTYDEFPEGMLVNAISQVDRLLRSPSVPKSDDQRVVEQFMVALSSKPPREVERIAYDLQSNYWNTATQGIIP